jgi:hypothetical protein
MEDSIKEEKKDWSIDNIVSFADLQLKIHFLLPSLFFCMGIPSGTGRVVPGDMDNESGRTAFHFHIRRSVQDSSGGRIGQGETVLRELTGKMFLVGVDILIVKVSTHSGTDQCGEGFVLEEPDPHLKLVLSLTAGV